MATAAQLHSAEHWEIKPTFCTNRNFYMFGFCREKQHASLSSNNFPNLHRPLPRIESGVYNKIEDMHDARKGRINVCIIPLNTLILLVVIFIKIEYFST